MYLPGMLYYVLQQPSLHDLTSMDLADAYWRQSVLASREYPPREGTVYPKLHPSPAPGEAKLDHLFCYRYTPGTPSNAKGSATPSPSRNDSRTSRTLPKIRYCENLRTNILLSVRLT